MGSESLKTLSISIASAAVAAGAVVWLTAPDPPSGPGPAGPSSAAQAAIELRILELEQQLAAERNRLGVLESTLVAMEGRLADANVAETEAPEPESASPGSRSQPRTSRDRPARPQDQADALRERRLTRLMDAGFSEWEAEDLLRTESELEMAQLRSMYARYRGEAESAPIQPQDEIREQLGDARYEDYLRAMDRPTSVEIEDVLASSPAESLDLQPGDRIVSYDGARVFATDDLTRLTFGGEGQELVEMEIQRGDDAFVVTIPRGPIGVRIRPPVGP